MSVCRDFRLTIISATGVEKFRKYLKTKLYARVTIGNDEATIQQTPTDKNHQTNPKWNHTVEYVIAATDVQYPTRLNLEIEIYLDRMVHHDKRVGYLSQTIHELFRLGFNNMQAGYGTSLTLPLVNDSGVTKGVVTFVYMFGEPKSVKKLSWAKKLVNIGTSLAVKTAVMSTTGIYMPTPVRVFRDPKIVSSIGVGSASSSLSGESVVEFIFEGAQNI